MRRFWEVFHEPWESIQIRIDQVREAGEQVVSLCLFEGRARDGMIVRREAAAVWTIRDGKVGRVVWFGTHAEALEAVGLSE